MATYYPPVGFHFKVDFEGFPSGGPDSGFQKVSGLSAKITTESVAEGGENRFAHRLPKPITYENLKMERGMLVGSELITWFRDAIEGFIFDPKDILVTLLNEKHEPLESWNFIKAWPSSWSIGEFDAEGGKIVIESIEFSYQYFTRVEVSTEIPALIT